MNKRPFTVTETKKRMKQGEDVSILVITTGRTGKVKPDPDNPKKPYWCTKETVTVLIDPQPGKRTASCDVRTKNLNFI